MNSVVDISAIREAAAIAVRPLEPGDGTTYFYGTRTNAGRDLPAYYLVYFLLARLLRYPYFGRQEKVAWSIPVRFDEQLFIIEHRKFGVGVFCQPGNVQEDQAKWIVSLVKKGIRVATPFFDAIAEDAISKSEVNCFNKGASLFKRYEFFLDRYEKVAEEAKARADEEIVETSQITDGIGVFHFFPAHQLRQDAQWLALAAIDCFFSWTEHIFIHLAVLLGKAKSAAQVVNLAGAEWSVKFKTVLSLDNADEKKWYDDLVLIRRQLRNFMAHGAFGKEGEAFTFHSEVGAVPVLLPHKRGRSPFTIVGELGFEEEAAISIMKEFITRLWENDRAPAYLYIQESELPTILTMANDGRYERAMKSVDDMASLIEELHYNFDNAANMDW